MIIKSLSVIIFVALLFAFGLRQFIGFLEVFAIAIALQILTSFIYKSLKISKAEELKQDFENAYDSLLALSNIDFMCPCGKKTFTEEIFVNNENIFKCNVCNNQVRVNLKVDPVLLTEIIDINQTFEDLQKKAAEKEQ